MTPLYTRIASPLGSLLLVSDGEALTGLHMEGSRDVPTPMGGWVPDPAPFAEAVRQLAAYWRGELAAFDLPLRPRGTPFQLRVWERLREIPHGETITYTELARRVGSPRGARAVGGATGRNPIAVIIPCHRVVGADGSLTGFAGGVERKEWLLGLEGGPAPDDPHLSRIDKRSSPVNPRTEPASISLATTSISFSVVEPRLDTPPPQRLRRCQAQLSRRLKLGDQTVPESDIRI